MSTANSSSGTKEAEETNGSAFSYKVADYIRVFNHFSGKEAAGFWYPQYFVHKGQVRITSETELWDAFSGQRKADPVAAFFTEHIMRREAEETMNESVFASEGADYLRVFNHYFSGKEAAETWYPQADVVQERQVPIASKTELQDAFSGQRKANSWAEFYAKFTMRREAENICSGTSNIDRQLYNFREIYCYHCKLPEFLPDLKNLGIEKQVQKTFFGASNQGHNPNLASEVCVDIRDGIGAVNTNEASTNSINQGEESNLDISWTRKSVHEITGALTLQLLVTIISNAISGSNSPLYAGEFAVLTGMSSSIAGLSLCKKKPYLSGIMIKIGALAIATATIISLGLHLPLLMAWIFGVLAFLIMAIAVALA